MVLGNAIPHAFKSCSSFSLSLSPSLSLSLILCAISVSLSVVYPPGGGRPVQVEDI